ncbi:MAG: S-methyl-5-thioribose-1-phosphate isomerase [Deltaproteobacteria bacterium]|nr:S-methyl-5-thioribose-1-phosphate isomerase [Deltaproteobacteria bacterium]
MFPKTIAWKDNRVVILDQRQLPEEEVYLECHNASAVAEAIKGMAIRGAPAIGIAAAMGIALGALGIDKKDFAPFYQELSSICKTLKAARPTAINLRWALERMKGVCEANKEKTVATIKGLLVKEALAILAEDIETNKRIGAQGKDLIHANDTILTHCNAGALATGGYGTALGVIRRAWEDRKGIKVIATETRPLLQGARLTAWELTREGIPVTLITDNMAGYLMQQGEINLCIVGADRIASNGDVANKIGTYTLAILAKEHGIPFYVAAPLSTFDRNTKTGQDIPIEERDAAEVATLWGRYLAPQGIKVRNPAFDVTPHRYVSAMVTEKGVIRPPFEKSLKRILRKDGG